MAALPAVRGRGATRGRRAPGRLDATSSQRAATALQQERQAVLLVTGVVLPKEAQRRLSRLWGSKRRGGERADWSAAGVTAVAWPC